MRENCNELRNTVEAVESGVQFEGNLRSDSGASSSSEQEFVK